MGGSSKGVRSFVALVAGLCGGLWDGPHPASGREAPACSLEFPDPYAPMSAEERETARRKAEADFFACSSARENPSGRPSTDDAGGSPQQAANNPFIGPPLKDSEWVRPANCGTRKSLGGWQIKPETEIAWIDNNTGRQRSCDLEIGAPCKSTAAASRGGDQYVTEAWLKKCLPEALQSVGSQLPLRMPNWRTNPAVCVEVQRLLQLEMQVTCVAGAKVTRAGAGANDTPIDNDRD